MVRKAPKKAKSTVNKAGNYAKPELKAPSSIVLWLKSGSGSVECKKSANDRFSFDRCGYRNQWSKLNENTEVTTSEYYQQLLQRHLQRGHTLY